MLPNKPIIDKGSKKMQMTIYIMNLNKKENRSIIMQKIIWIVQIMMHLFRFLIKFYVINYFYFNVRHNVWEKHQISFKEHKFVLILLWK